MNILWTFHSLTLSTLCNMTFDTHLAWKKSCLSRTGIEPMQRLPRMLANPDMVTTTPSRQRGLFSKWVESSAVHSTGYFLFDVYVCFVASISRDGISATTRKENALKHSTGRVYSVSRWCSGPLRPTSRVSMEGLSFDGWRLNFTDFDGWRWHFRAFEGWLLSRRTIVFQRLFCGQKHVINVLNH